VLGEDDLTDLQYLRGFELLLPNEALCKSTHTL
jgi:hypothetical protein